MWIPCNVRLPQTWEEVIVVVADKWGECIRVARLNNKGVWQLATVNLQHSYSYSYVLPDEHVKAWYEVEAYKCLTV